MLILGLTNRKGQSRNMADSPKGRTPLVAPKRSFPEKKVKEPSAPKARKAPKPAKAKVGKAAKPKAKRGNIFVRLFGGLFKFIFKLFWWTTSTVVVVGCLVLGSAVFYYFGQLPNASVLMDDRQKGSVTMLDAKGDVFAWRGDQFGGEVTSATVSPNLKNAVIATEDKRFYRHLGISPRGIAGAIRINLREGRKPWQGNGGSTITQQLAKRIYFEDLGSLERKIKEVPMSMAMELKYTKDEILTIYLNRAFLGSGAFGFEAASQRYFGKSARDVNPAEAAMLAGLLKAPSASNPIRNLDRAQKRANLIVGLMEDQGYLTQAQATQARNNPAQLSQVAAEKAGGYFADWVLTAAPEFIIKDANADVIIQTTFDKRIQRSAEEALEVVFQKLKAGSEAQGAIVVMSRDGAVRAMVGGRKTGLAGSFNRATQALRQTGSAFKPFVYAAALETGLRYDSIVTDEPISISTPSGPYSPQNYNRKFEGDVTLTHALAKSTNIVAVKLSEQIGRARVQAVATDFGITNEIPLVPSMALGAGESTLLEMTGAFAGILNQGVAARPYGLSALTIQGESDPLLQNDPNTGLRVINESAANQLTYMMNQVVKDGTGRRADLGDRQAAGKTGTTQGARDAWFIGFTADYVAGVWMGYDDNRKLTGVTGGGLPADIWRETMTRVHQGMPLSELNMDVPAPVFTPNQRTDQDEIDNVFKSIEDEIKKIEDQMKKDTKKTKDDFQSLFKKIFGGN
jgi:1A family penicillin-binding protein